LIPLIFKKTLKLKVNLIKYLSVVFFTLLIISSACDTKKVYDSNFTLPADGWKNNSAVVFNDVLISDTTALQNFYIKVRNADDYRYSNFYLFLTTKLPNGKLSRDTIEIKLAGLNGQWLGKGFGHFKDNQVLIRKAMRFPASGKYEFTLEQAMREELLKGIANIGIRIEKL
jgi:gliding motility-associated lipoprotein GldH